MTDWMNLPPQDLAQITLSVVVPREMMTSAPSRALMEAADEIIGADNVLHSTVWVGNVQEEIYSSARRSRSFDEYMTRSSQLLQPLVDHIGGFVTQTGGGCLAISLETATGDRFGRSDGGSYILVADTDGPLELPDEDWTIEGREYSVGVYNGEDEGWVTFEGVTFEGLPDAIQFAHLIAEKSDLTDEEFFATIEEAKEKYA